MRDRREKQTNKKGEILDGWVLLNKQIIRIQIYFSLVVSYLFGGSIGSWIESSVIEQTIGKNDIQS